MNDPEESNDKKTVDLNAVHAIGAKSGEAKADAGAAATLQAQLSDPGKSAMQRYQLVSLGTTSKFQLFKFELITLLAAGLPGALGLVTRKLLYPKILGTVGRNVVFGKGITLRHPQKIHIGDDVVIDDGAVLDAKGETNLGITIDSGAFISRNAVLSCKNGNIRVGRGSVIGINNLVHAMEGSDVTLGDDVLVAAFVYLVGSGPYRTERLDLPFKKQGMVPQGGVHIADNVWVGSGAQVLDGVSVGEGAILASNAVVNKSVNAFDVVGGVPARLIKSRKG